MFWITGIARKLLFIEKRDFFIVYTPKFFIITTVSNSQSAIEYEAPNSPPTNFRIYLLTI